MRRNRGRNGLLTDRFDLCPLVRGTVRRVQNRSADTTDDDITSRDWGGIVVLLGVPPCCGIASALFHVALSKPDQLVAGFALLSGSLLAAFAVLAMWRDNLDDPDLEDAAARINEAVGHTLLAVVASIFGAATMVFLSNLPDPSTRMHALKVGLSSVGIGLGSYVVLSLIVMANLTWDAYEQRIGADHATTTTKRTV